MIIIIYVFIILLNFVFAFRQKHSKKIALLSLIMILLLMAGAGPNYTITQSRDYLNYKINYENIGSNAKSIFDDIFIGFNILMKIGNLLNISFFYFRMIIIAICLFLIYHFIIKKYAYNYNYIILFYMLYPMIIDSEQLKNFIAFTFLFIGISFLLKKSFRGKLFFVLFLFLASSIHLAFILYLPLILINITYKNEFIAFVFLFLVFIILLIIINGNQIPFISLLIKYIDNERVKGYLTSKTNYGFLIPFFLNFLNMALIFCSRKIIVNNKKNRRNIEGNNIAINRDYTFVDIIFWINIISIIYFPLYINSITFYRLSRNLIILNILVFSISSIRLKRKTNKYLFNLVIFMYVFLWLYFDLVLMTSVNRILIPFFLKNFFNIF